MPKAKNAEVADLSDLAQTGASLSVRVTPRASRACVERGKDGVIRVMVTCAAEAGRANRAVACALAGALRVAPSRLELRQGLKSRDKRFVLR